MPLVTVVTERRYVESMSDARTGLKGFFNILLGQGWNEIRQCGTEGEQERILIVVRRSLMERRRTHNAACRFFDEVDG